MSTLKTTIREVAANYWYEAYGLRVGALIRSDSVRRVEWVEKWADCFGPPLIKCSHWLNTEHRWSKTTTIYCPNFQHLPYMVLSPEETEAFLSTHQEAAK